MTKYPWACNGDYTLFVVCHRDDKTMREQFPYGICCPIPGVSSASEIADILEDQDTSEARI